MKCQLLAIHRTKCFLLIGGMNVSCRCAKQTDEWHGWECSITEGPCMFLYPSSKACAEEYGEGPDACEEEEE